MTALAKWSPLKFSSDECAVKVMDAVPGVDNWKSDSDSRTSCGAPWTLCYLPRNFFTTMENAADALVEPYLVTMLSSR
jgi:hypothetical protein